MAETRFVYTVQVAMIGVVKGTGALAPKKFRLHEPEPWAVPKISLFVFAMAIPVSLPLVFDTDEKSRGRGVAGRGRGRNCPVSPRPTVPAPASATKAVMPCTA